MKLYASNKLKFCLAYKITNGNVHVKIHGITNTS